MLLGSLRLAVRLVGVVVVVIGVVMQKVFLDTLHLNPPQVPTGYPKPQPGQFLLSVLAASALAPVAFLAAAIVARAGKQRRRHTDAAAQPDDPGDRYR
jgi:hypothetical protein